MNREVKLLLRRIFIFTLPFIFFFSFSTLVLYLSGELTPIDEIIEKQESSEDLVLLGLAYSNPFKYYKLNSVIEREPDIVALGTSRVMQFRSTFFKDATFFNAGGGVRRLKDYRIFIESLPDESSPELLIVGLDQWFFNPVEDELSMEETKQEYQRDNHRFTVLADSPVIMAKDYFVERKFSYADFKNKLEETSFGFNAMVRKNGFRNDGSYLYGEVLMYQEEAVDFQFKKTYQLIADRAGDYEASDMISSKSLKEVALLLKACKKKNIKVIGFLPPFANEIYQTMQASNDYRYLFELEDALQPVFDKHGFSFFNFSDLKTTGSTDKEIFDGSHGSEKAYLKLFILMAEKDQFLRQYVDFRNLRERLNRSDNNFLVFDHDEF